MDLFSLIILGVFILIIFLIGSIAYWIWHKLYLLNDEEKSFLEWENELNPIKNEDNWS